MDESLEAIELRDKSPEPENQKEKEKESSLRPPKGKEEGKKPGNSEGKPEGKEEGNERRRSFMDGDEFDDSNEGHTTKALESAKECMAKYSDIIVESNGPHLVWLANQEDAKYGLSLPFYSLLLFSSLLFPSLLFFFLFSLTLHASRDLSMISI
jgi:hypothetical protein